MSTLKVTNLQHPSAASANVTLDASGNADFNGKNLAGVASVNGGQLGGSNLIQNGAMVISQRYGTAVQSPAPSGYGIDRWATYKSGAGTFSIQQSTDGPSGFSNSALITVTSNSTPSGGDYYIYQHKVEGYNIAQLDWGTADAKDVTLSFWVKSSVTGTFSGSFRNAPVSHSYVFEYTVNSANTWEYKSINISGPTVGTWGSTNGAGIVLLFSLGQGTTYATSTVGSWVSGNFHGSTTETDLIATSAATWQVTGAMLETGDTATSYPHEDVGTTLQKCLRYYEEIDDAGTYRPNGIAFTTTNTNIPLQFSVQKRAAPTVTVVDVGQIYRGGAWRTPTGSSVIGSGTYGCTIDIQQTSFSTENGYFIRNYNFTFDAEL